MLRFGLLTRNVCLNVRVKGNRKCCSLAQVLTVVHDPIGASGAAEVNWFFADLSAVRTHYASRTNGPTRR